MKKVHAETMYINSDNESIHSDICPPECNIKNLTNEYRKFLHDCLDEWLDKANSTGCFYIKEEKVLIPRGPNDAQYHNE